MIKSVKTSKPSIKRYFNSVSFKSLSPTSLEFRTKLTPCLAFSIAKPEIDIITPKSNYLPLVSSPGGYLSRYTCEELPTHFRFPLKETKRGRKQWHKGRKQVVYRQIAIQPVSFRVWQALRETTAREMLQEMILLYITKNNIMMVCSICTKKRKKKKH